MKQTITKPEPTKVVINFVASPDEWDQALNKAYDKKKSNYTIQGFRKGKAPRKVIEQNYGDTVFFDEAINVLAQQAYVEALTKNTDIDPIGDPDLNIIKLDSNGFEAEIKLNIIPPVKLGAYKGLKLEANFAEFKPEMVDDQIKSAQAHFAENKIVNRAAEIGDIVTIDFVGSVDGVEFDGGKATNYDLELGSKSFVDTFEDQLLGTKAGEHKTVNVTFPKDYGAKSLANKKAVFECDIHAVKERVLPEVNDEFAKKVGDFKDVAEFREQVEEQIKHSLLHENQNIKQDAVMNAIIKNSEVVVPDIMVEHQLNHIMQDLEYRLTYQGLNLQDYAAYLGTTVDALRAERKADAERVCQMKLVYEAIIKAEKMKIEQSELDAQIEEIAKIQGKTTEQVKKDLDPHRLEHLQSDILMNKLNAFLDDNNQVVSSKTKKEVCTKHNCGEEEVKKPAKKASTATKKDEQKAEAKAEVKTTEKAKSGAKTSAASKTETTAKKACKKESAKEVKTEAAPKRKCATKKAKEEK